MKTEQTLVKQYDVHVPTKDGKHTEVQHYYFAESIPRHKIEELLGEDAQYVGYVDKTKLQEDSE